MIEATAKIKKINPGRSRTFGYSYAPTQLTYTLLDGLYDRTILKKIIQKYIANVIPSFYTLTIEDEDGNRLPELEKKCKKVGQIINRRYMRELLKAWFLYGTAPTYTGNRDEEDMYEEVFILHPRDLDPKFILEPGARYGDLEYWNYNYGGVNFRIPPEHIKIFANDPDIGNLYGNSLVNQMQDTLHQFLNNRLDLAEILNRYAIPIVQWAVDVSEVGTQNEDDIINKARMMLEQQFFAGDDIVCDARIEPRTLSFANDVGHLINILQESRRDLGMVSIPESLLGGQISNLSGGKTQAAVFMVEIGDIRAVLNDFLAEEYYIPYLEKLGYERGSDFHNVYIAFPLATTELPSESIIWIAKSIEMGLITLDEGRANLGFRGAAPGVTPDLESIFKARSIQYDSGMDTGNKDNTGSTKADEPKDRSGKDPDADKRV